VFTTTTGKWKNNRMPRKESAKGTIYDYCLREEEQRGKKAEKNILEEHVLGALGRGQRGSYFQPVKGRIPEGGTK